MIDGEMTHLLIKSTWVGDFCASCHITTMTGLFDVTKINKLVQESSANMSAMKKGEHHMKVCQVNGRNSDTYYGP